MKKILSVIIVVALCAFTSSPKEIQFQYVFKKGDTFAWEQTAKVRQHILVAGTEQDVVIDIKGAMLLKTIDVKGSSARFEVEYTSLYMNTSSQAMNISMDSQGDTSKIFNKVVSAMMGKKFNFSLTKNGTVESVENIENLWSGLTKYTDAQGAQMKASLEKSFGKDSFKRTVESALIYYPDQKIAAGSTWKRSTDAGMGLPLMLDNTFTVQSITEPNASVVSDGVITTSDSTKVISTIPGFKSTANLKGRQVVKYSVSVSEGWPLTSKTYSEVKGKMTLLAGGPIPEDMPMQMEIVTEAEYTIKKK